MTFAQKLDFLMKEKFISSYALAKQLGAKTSTVSGWLSGREPQNKYVKGLCEYFDITYEVLMDNNISLVKNDKKNIPSAEYEVFESLLKENNVTAYKVSKETGIPTSTFTAWKKGSYVPKIDKLQKIADYFEVSLEFLLTGDNTEKSPQRSAEGLKEIVDLFSQLNPTEQEQVLTYTRWTLHNSKS